MAFFNENEKIIQLGDPDEEDETTIKGKSQTLVNQTFDSSSSWGTAAKALWTQNEGVTVPSDVVKAGTIAAKAASYTVAAKATNTSGKVLSNAKSDVGSPYIYYSVSLQTSNRTSTSVKVKVTITASLATSASYFGNGLGLSGSLYIGGSWYTVTIKKTSAYWKGKTAHTVNMTVTVTGLSSTTSSLTGIKFKVVRTDAYGSSGKLNERSCSSIKISAYETSVPATYYLGASSYGTSAGNYHGPTITRTIASSQDFTLTYKQKMTIGSGKTDSNQMGAFHVTLSDSAGTVIAGVRILKNKAGKNASLIFYVNGKMKYTGNVDVSYNSDAIGTSSIIKSGAKVSFNVGGCKKTFSDTAIKDTGITRLTIGFEQYSAVTALAHNGLYWAKFIKNNRDTYKDIPNNFSTDDVLEADCKSGEIYLNGVRAPQLGALGNDWEEFCLIPGINQIGVAYSSWVADAYAPTFKVRYREAYL